MKRNLPILLVLTLVLSFTGCTQEITDISDVKDLSKSQSQKISPTDMCNKLNGEIEYYSSGSIEDKMSMLVTDLYYDINYVEKYYEVDLINNQLPGETIKYVFNISDKIIDERYLYGIALKIGQYYGQVATSEDIYNTELVGYAEFEQVVVDLDEFTLHKWKIPKNGYFNDDGLFISEETYNVTESVFSYNPSSRDLVEEEYSIRREIFAGREPYDEMIVPRIVEKDEDSIRQTLIFNSTTFETINRKEEDIESNEETENFVNDEESGNSLEGIDYYAVGIWYVEGDRYDEDSYSYEREFRINNLGNGHVSIELSWLNKATINCEMLLEGNTTGFVYNQIMDNEARGTMTFSSDEYGNDTIIIEITSSTLDYIPVETIVFNARHGGIFDDGRDPDEID